MKYNVLEGFVELVERLFPELRELALERASEFETMIDQGNPAPLNSGAKKIFSSFIIRFYRELEGLEIRHWPQLNMQVLNIIKDFSPTSLLKDEEMRQDIIKLIKGWPEFERQ